MDVDRIPVKLVDGPAPDGFTDPGGIAQGLDNIANGGLGGLYGGNTAGSWDQETPMTGSHIPGVDTGARGGQTTFMGSGGRMETIGSGTGSFGGSAPGGSTPYESMLRDRLLGQLPPENSGNAVSCSANPQGASPETAATVLAIGGITLEGTGLAAKYASGWSGTADWTQYLGKASPWLEGVGRTLGWAGVFTEGGSGILNDTYADLGHAGVDGTILVVSTRVGGAPGFLVGAAWTALDQGMQHYSFQGQHGWSALINAQAWQEVQNGMRNAQSAEGLNAARPALQRVGLIPR